MGRGGLSGGHVVRVSGYSPLRVQGLRGGLAVVTSGRKVRFICKGKGEGPTLRRLRRRLRRYKGQLVRCGRYFRVVKGSEGDCSGASLRTAFVHVGRSRVLGKRLGPTCGIRVTMRGCFVMRKCMDDSHASCGALVPILRGRGGTFKDVLRRMATSDKCYDRGGLLCLGRGRVSDCVGLRSRRGQGAHTCSRSVDGCCGVEAKVFRSRRFCVYRSKHRLQRLEARDGRRSKCARAFRMCNYTSYDKYRRGTHYLCGCSTRGSTRGGGIVGVGRR